MSDPLDEWHARRRLEHERDQARRGRRPKPRAGDKHAATLADSRALKVAGKPCRRCGAKHGIEAHHVVHRSKIGSRSPYVHDPANLIPLCRACHTAHHSTDRRTPRACLTSVELTFAKRHANPSWLDAWYPIPDATRAG